MQHVSKNSYYFLLFWWEKNANRGEIRMSRYMVKGIRPACNHRCLVKTDLCLDNLENVFSKTIQS